MAISQDTTTLIGVAVTALGILVGAAVQIITSRNTSAIARSDAARKERDAVDLRRDAELQRALADGTSLRADLIEANDLADRLRAENLDLTRQLAEELLRGSPPSPSKPPPKKRTRRTS